MSTRTSTTKLNLEDPEPNILEKIPSETFPVELTPVPSPTISDVPLDDKDDSPDALETGRSKQHKGKQPITHRPTGVKVHSLAKHSNL